MQAKKMYVRQIVNRNRSRKARKIIALRRRRKEARRWLDITSVGPFLSGECGVFEGIAWLEFAMKPRRYRSHVNGQVYTWRHSSGTAFGE